jgi:hypothetical protein
MNNNVKVTRLDEVVGEGTNGFEENKTKKEIEVE